MASQNQGDVPPVLPIVGCPDCGRKVVTYVARRGQYAGERFYKCGYHNPSAGDVISTGGKKRTPSTSHQIHRRRSRRRKLVKVHRRRSGRRGTRTWRRGISVRLVGKRRAVFCYLKLPYMW
ncbi:hypothetical protein ACQJBY_068340 [Aegilops geniculata]